MFNNLSLLHDQQLGGILMKILQEIIYGVVLFQVFFEWFRSEQQEGEELDRKAKAFNPQRIG